MFKSSKISLLLTSLILALLALGLLILLSAGIVDGQRKFGDPYFYVKHQLFYGILPGLLLFFIFSKINYQRLRAPALILLILALALTALVFIPGIGVEIKGSQRWVDFGFFTFQPSEFLKLALIIYFAAWFSKSENDGSHRSRSITPFLLIVGATALLLILQPDFGTLGITIIIILAMYFFAGAGIISIAGIVAASVAMFLLLSVVSPYRFNRIKAFLDPTSDTKGISYHITQSLIGIGSGGAFGAGWGHSKQKMAYLPEPVGDSIFAIYAEETGLLGAGILIILFLALIFVLFILAKNAPDKFSKLFISGIMVWITGQTFINIGAVTGIMPLTGLPLPFVSYGSSSLVALLLGLGIVNNIAKNA